MLRFPTLCVLATFTCFTGCLDRTETITVSTDGALLIEHQIRGDAADLRHGAARFPADPTFACRHTTEIDAEGEPIHVLRATARFADARAVPTRFGGPDDPMAVEGLHFTTELQTEKTADGVRFRFVRTYGPRRWAEYSYLRARAVPTEVEELLDDLDHFWRKTPAERRAVVDSMLDLDRRLRQYWAEIAMNELTGRSVPQATDLRVRAAIREHSVEHANVETFLAAMQQGEDALSLVCTSLANNVSKLTVTTIANELQLDQAAARRIAKRLQTLEHAYNVDQDLEDEHFTVRLRLPGVVEVHNGESANNGEVEWRFSGKDLRDRTQVLVAHSLWREG